MTGVETAARLMEQTGKHDVAPGKASGPAPVSSPLRARMQRKMEYWRSLRELDDEQAAALEFWEEYFQVNP